MHPLGLVYKSEPENELERKHIAQLVNELNTEKIDYSLDPVPGVGTDINVYGEHGCDTEAIQCEYTCSVVWLSSVELKEGEAVFLPPSASSYDQLNEPNCDNAS